MEEQQEVNKAKSYKVTEAMKRAAERGLRLREKYGRGGLDTRQAAKEGVGSGVARARDILGGSLSLESVKRMHAFFSRHDSNIRNAKKQPDGGPSAAKIAADLWGGSPGRAWARSILRQEGLLKSVDTEIAKQYILTKSLNQELKQVTYVAMKPGIDLHGDYVDLETIRLAKESFNRQLRKSKMSNLYHISFTDTFDVIESFLAPADMELNGNFVQKGEWLMTLQVNDDDVWQMIKDDEITGLSIGAMAAVEVLED